MPVITTKAGTYTEIDIESREGLIRDAKFCVCIMEQGRPETAMPMQTWADVGRYDHEYRNPVYALFVRV